MNELLRCKNKKAKEIERILSEELEETVQIRKGAPDARYKEGYFAYMTTFNGFQAVGTYGALYKHSKTLAGLLDD